MPIFFEELGLRPFEVGIILSANRWIRLGTNELAHRLMGSTDQRRLFAAALTIGAITTAVYASTPGFVVFVAARLTWGLCWSFIRHMGVLSVMAVDGGRRAGHAAGRLGGISRAGSVAGLFGGALVVDRLGFGPALLALAMVSVAAVPIGWAGYVPVPDRPPQRRETSDGRHHLVTGALGFAHGMVGPGLVMATLGAVLDDRMTGNGWLSAATLTGAVLALRFVVESAAAARLGAISDRRGVRLACAGSFAVGSASLIVAAVSPSLALLIVAVIAFFIAGTALGAALIGFVGSDGSKSLARYVTASDLGSASGPLLGWIALGLFDQRTLGLGLGAIVYAAAGIVAARYLAPPDARRSRMQSSTV